ncbi:hypothetical protein B0H11DRAFT_2282566 [Mycena galericulata]|nr:hypothetical protein B0H11DRAFT_2282566 [Mycena galericulata]
MPDKLQNWHESWETLRASLKELEDSEMQPYAAVMKLLHVERAGDEPLSLDTASVAHLENRLGTNYVPTEGERKQIQTFCARGFQQASDIWAETERFRQNFLTSDAWGRSLYECVYSYWALISPMRAMPPEVLQEIFIACLPEHHYATMDASQAPLLLGRVCSSWRTISLSTPALWSTVHVASPLVMLSPFDHDRSVTEMLSISQHRSEALNAWLQRSGNCPLSISFFAGTREDTVNQLFLDTIIRFNIRWKALKLSSKSEVKWNLCPEDVPMLELLEINSMCEIEQNSLNLLVAPRLRSISLDLIDDMTLPPTCSWDRLTALHLRCYSSSAEVLEIIAHCINLQTCSLTLPSTWDDGFPPSSSTPIQDIILPGLEALYIAAGRDMDAPCRLVTILDSLTLPCLQQLHIVPYTGTRERSASDPRGDPMRALEELVVRSSCSLKSLSIGSMVLIEDVAALLRCLRCSSALTSLNLDFNLQTEILPILTELTPSPSSPTPLCPNLVHIRLKYCDVSDAYHPVLWQLIQSRSSCSRLHTATILLRLASTLDWDALITAMYPSLVRVYGYGVARTIKSPWAGIPNKDLEAEQYTRIPNFPLFSSYPPWPLNEDYDP